jgi:nicotinamide-nucleotide amidase
MDRLLPLAARVGTLLKERKETLGVAETTAGGLISASLLAMPGASNFFIGGVVPYSGPPIRTFMGVTREDMQGKRSSSEPYAQLLAARVREKLGTSWGLGETGAAGPFGTYGDAAGHSCIAVAGPNGIEAVMTLETGKNDRVENMYAFADEALNLLLKALS